jgi:hypothetical protein
MSKETTQKKEHVEKNAFFFLFINANKELIGVPWKDVIQNDSGKSRAGLAWCRASYRRRFGEKRVDTGYENGAHQEQSGRSRGQVAIAKESSLEGYFEAAPVYQGSTVLGSLLEGLVYTQWRLANRADELPAQFLTAFLPHFIVLVDAFLGSRQGKVFDVLVQTQ